MSSPRAKSGVTGNTAYRRYVLAQALSNAGTFMEYTALYWLVNRLSSGSAVSLAIVSGAEFLPLMLLSAFAGRQVATRDRTWVLTYTQAAQACLSLSLAVPVLVQGRVPVLYVCCVALSLGCVHSYDVPGRQMFMRDLVGDEDLRRGVSLYSTAVSLSRIAGPAMAGFLIAAVNEGLVFLINAVSFLLVLAAVNHARSSVMKASRSAVPPRQRGRRFPASLLDGVPRDLLPPVVLALVLGGFAYQFHVTGPLMVAGLFRGTSSVYGLVGAATAVGSVAGSFLSGHWSGASAERFPLWAFAFGVAEFMAAVAPNLIVYGVAMVFVGGALALFTTSAVVHIQQQSDSISQGPALGAYNLAYLGFVPVGGVLVAFLASTLGTRYALAIPAMALLAVTLLMTIGQWSRKGTTRTPATAGTPRKGNLV